MVQVSDSLPTDKLMVRWSPRDAPLQHVATLTLPRQDVATRGQGTYGERLAFNPWRTLAAHEPLGSIAEARKVAYAASADLRRDTNGTPRGEPDAPRPPRPYPGGDARIVRCAIHPAIGVARVGNSEDGWFYGPEVADPPAADIRHHRDSCGKLERQAARFRVYGYDADGNVVRELTASDAEIAWSVELANLKAAWYQFDRALDIPEAKGTKVPLRNANVKDRSTLAIQPGPREISGRSSPPVSFDTGRFLGESVYLGELRTDESGRLIVLGGRGVSNSPEGKPLSAEQFNNVDGWHDDTSDGPVRVTVVVGGRTIPCEPAWVVVAPPNFAPDVKGWRTMYDLRVDVARTSGALPLPERPSFSRDILHILTRLSGLQWVNAGFAAFLCPEAGEQCVDLRDSFIVARVPCEIALPGIYCLARVVARVLRVAEVEVRLGEPGRRRRRQGDGLLASASAARFTSPSGLKWTDVRARCGPRAPPARPRRVSGLNAPAPHSCVRHGPSAALVPARLRTS